MRSRTSTEKQLVTRLVAGCTDDSEDERHVYRLTPHPRCRVRRCPATMPGVDDCGRLVQYLSACGRAA